MLLATLRPHSTILSPDRGRVASFDREGRLLTFFRRGRTYKRSLAGEIHLRYRDGGRVRQKLGAAQGRGVVAEAYELARGVLSQAEAELATRLRQEILPWTPETLEREEERFDAVYRPISILPPDQYRAVVLQATEGCTWNRCTFCNFYMDRPFRLQGPEEFRRHALGVRDLLGRGLGLRRDIFLADGNALAVGDRKLVPLIEIARELFPGRALAGFVDLYSGERRTVESWRMLAKLELRRVYVGMETGLDELLAFIGKPGSADELVGFVEMLKAAGLGVALIVMVGLGGERYRDAHRRATLRAIERMPLGREDLVYLSPFIEHRDSGYAERRRNDGIRSLAASEVEAELAGLAGGIRERGVRAARYDIREFVF